MKGSSNRAGVTCAKCCSDSFLHLRISIFALWILRPTQMCMVMVAIASILWRSAQASVMAGKMPTTSAHRRRQFASSQSPCAPSTRAMSLVSIIRSLKVHQTNNSGANDAVTAQLIVDEVGNGNRGRDTVGNQTIPPLVVCDLTAIEALDLEDDADVQGHTEDLPMSARSLLRRSGYLPRTGLRA